MHREYSPEDERKAGATDVLVGRSRELGDLTAGLADARAGRGGLFLLVGEPGIGKTRLADEFSTRAQAAGTAVFWGRCWEGGGAPVYWPWVQVVRSYLRQHDPAALRRELRAGAGHLAQIVPELREAIPDLPAAPGPNVENLRFALFDAMSEFLHSAARREPVVLVLDDLHAADPPSLLMLQFVARELRTSRLLVVGSYRDAEPRVDPEVATLLAGLARHGRRIPLPGLGRQDVAVLIARACSGAPDPGLAAEIHRRTEGNPFFVDEVVRLLRAEGRLEEGAPSRGTLGIPAGVRDAIDQRVGMLSPRTRHVLTVAAVVGRDFDARVLERCIGLAADDVLVALDEAIATRLVVGVLRAAGRYSFCHALVRETLYEALPAQQRVRLHHEVGEALERLHDGDDAHLPELAHHFFEAAPAGGAANALELSQAAGDRAREMLAYEEARGHYDRALQSMTLAAISDEPRRCDLLLRRAECEWSSGDSAAARSTFRQSAEIARRTAAPELLAAAALGYARGLGGFLHVVRADETIIAFLEEALVAVEERDSALRARLLARLAVELYYTDQVDRRAALSREAIDIARRLDDRAALLVALYSRHWAACGPETLAERLANATEIVTLARELRDTEMTFLGHNVRVGCLLERCDAEPVDREIRAITQLADEVRQPFYRWRATCLAVMRAILDARFADAEHLADAAFAIGEGSDPEMAAVVRDGSQQFALRFGQGRLAELEPSVLDFTRRYPWIQPWRLPLLYAHLRRVPDAQAELERQAAGDFLDFPHDALWITRVAALADACALVGDAARARQLHDLLLPFADRNVSTIADQSYGPVATRLGMLAAVLERWDEAEGHFRAGARHCRSLRSPTFMALNLCEHARMLLVRDRDRDREMALTLLEEAEALSRTHGVEGVLARVLAEQARAAGSTRAARRFRRDGEYWTIVFEDDVFRMKDSKGLRYVAQLLANPGTEIHALHLVAMSGPRAGDAVSPPPPPGHVAQDDLHPSALGGVGPALDAEAKAAYRRRLQELEAEAEEARAFNDPERAALVEEERDAVVRELTAAVGLGSRDREVGSPGERARVNVTRSIRNAIGRIEASSPALARHLTGTIRTGAFCAYLPAGDSRGAWEH